MIDSIYEDGRRYDSLWSGDGADIEFWIPLLKEFGGPVLELACGTGKYFRPASAAGLDIFGLDLSEAMLAEARRKLGSSAAPKLIMADMRHFVFNGKFRCALIAGNSLCHLLTAVDFESCLRCTRRHLLPDGRLLINVFVPDLGVLNRDSTVRYPFSRFIDPLGGEVVIEYTHIYDAARQVNYVTTYTRERSSQDERIGYLTMRMDFPEELDAALRYCGFSIEHKFGGYEKEAFTSASKKQLIIAKPN